jgi:hypothetical protein
MIRRALLALAALVGIVQPALSQATLFAGGYAPPTLPAVCTAPPTLPLASGAKLAGLGDSVLGLGLTASNATNSISTRMESILEAAWARNPNFTYENWGDTSAPWGTINPWSGANMGIAGDHMDWSSIPFGNGILPRARYVASRGPAIVYLQGGGNSINSGDSTGEDGAGGYNAATGTTTPATAAYVERKLDSAINQLTCRGIWVILQVILPDAYWASGDPRHQIIRDVNVWIRAQSGRTGVKVLDPYNALVSTTDPDAVQQALYQEQINLTATPPVYGGVHPNQAGAWVIVRDYLGPLLDTMVSSGTVFSQDPTVSNLLASNIALMNGGTGGGLSAGGVNGGATPVAPTGQSPSLWTVNALRGSSTSVASIDTSPGTYDRLVLNVTPVNDAYTGAFHEIDVTPATQTFASSVPAGSWVQALIHIETPTTGVIGDGPSNVFGTWSVLNSSSVVLASNRAQLEYTGLNAFPNYGRGGYWLRFPPILVPATGPATKSTFTLSILFPKTNPAFTVKVDRFIIRQVPDPRPTWNLQ